MPKAIRGTTQDFIDIEDIRDDLVVFKDGSCVLIIETSAVNFGLLSEREQDALIYAFAAFLNSLSFPVQILISSRKMDISSYLELIKNQAKKQQSEKMRDQIQKYHQFITNIVQENEVLEKRFFIVLPFVALELGVKGGVPTLGKTKKRLPYNIAYIIKRAQTSLFPKRDHILRQLSRLGLRGVQLSTQQLIELYYNLFNPEISKEEKIIDSQQYTQAIVSNQ